MTVQPLAPWVRWTRIAIIVIGFGWVPCLFVWHRFVAHSEYLRFVIIAVVFLWGAFCSWILALSVLLPTHKLRIVGAPVVFLILYFLPSQSPDPLGKLTPAFAVWLVLWLTTCVAVTLLVPQLTAVAAFIIFVAKDMRRRWMRRRTARAN